MNESDHADYADAESRLMDIANNYNISEEILNEIEVLCLDRFFLTAAVKLSLASAGVISVKDAGKLLRRVYN